MRVVSWNVNGLRAALRKGFTDIIDELKPDVVLLQEIRVMPEQLTEAQANPQGWHVQWHPAEKKGYAGTAIWSREPLTDVTHGIGEHDVQGRVLSATTNGVRVVSVYPPSGSSGPEKQANKEVWLKQFAPWAGELRLAGRPAVMGGVGTSRAGPAAVWGRGGVEAGLHGR